MNPVIANSRLVNEIVSFILNLIGKKNNCRITITGKDYSRLEILWGMVLIEKGEKREIKITGTEKYYEHYVKNLEKNQFRVKRLPK